MTHNQIDFARLKEERRHNVVGEQETGRHNKASEAIGATSASAAVSQAAASHRMASETARHNVVTEGINWYSAENLAMLQGAQAYNQGQMGDKAKSEVGVRAGELGETQRHNVTTEHETQRHNIVSEGIEQQKAHAATKDAATRRGQAITGGVKDIVDSASGIVSILGKIK